MKTIVVFFYLSFIFSCQICMSQIESSEVNVAEDMPVFSSMDISVVNNEKYDPEKPNNIPTGTNINRFYDKYKYSLYELDENTKTISLKTDDYYNSKCGLVKNDILTLPMIFKNCNKGYYSKNIIFQLDASYGVFDYEKNMWIIPFIYNSISEPKSNIFIASKAGKYGIIDNKNTVIQDFVWDYINVYEDKNFAIVSFNRKYGVLNILNNKIVVPVMYESIEWIYGYGKFKVQLNKKYNVINVDNQLQFKTWYDEINYKEKRNYFVVKVDNKMGVIDGNDNVIVPIEYKFIKNYPYEDGSYLAQNKDGKYGCILLDGRISLPFEYDNIDYDSYNSKIISIKNNKCGIVVVNDGMPYEIVNCEYDSITVSGNSFIARKNGKFGLINQQGQKLTDFIYDNIIQTKVNDSYRQNTLFIGKIGQDISLIDPDGKLVSDKKYLSIAPIASPNESSYSGNNYYKFTDISKKCGLLNSLGMEVISATFTDIVALSNTHYLIVKSGSKYGIYSLLKNTFVVPAVYDQITNDKSTYYAFKGQDIFWLNDTWTPLKM